jgi:outer membrane protein OmpA-like peptidoglycan-associated protein
MGGVTFNFGEPPAPPPAPAPEPVAPPPPAPEPVVAPPPPVCSPGPFIVFFEWDKSDITPEAASILDNAIAQYANCGNAQVMLAGHADRSGSAQYNVGLSQRRADAVKAYMVAHAIPDAVVTEQAFGESRPRVETADGVREVQNRRVEITYGPGSGQ